MLAVIALGLTLPLLAYPILRLLGRFERADAASIAAHYGSVSVGTYAVPAAMRISLPEANPTLSLAASLGITFPFNVLVGIPLYYALALRAHALVG